MNLYIGVGVLIGTPTIQKLNDKENLVVFKMATIDEVNGKPIYLNCVANSNVGFNIYTKGKDGTPLVIRGRLGFNRQKNSNYVQASYVEFLFDSFSKPVQMGLKEFLEIYSPKNIMQNLKELEKEQRKKQKEEEKCLDMLSSSDISSQEQ